MSMPDLTESQLAAQMSIVTIARTRETRSLDALRADAIRLGLDAEDTDAAIAFWSAHLRETYPDPAKLGRAQGLRDHAEPRSPEPIDCLVTAS